MLQAMSVRWSRKSGVRAAFSRGSHHELAHAVKKTRGELRMAREDRVFVKGLDKTWKVLTWPVTGWSMDVNSSICLSYLYIYICINYITIEIPVGIPESTTMGSNIACE